MFAIITETVCGIKYENCKIILVKCNEELKGLYSSPNIVRVIKSRRMRWAGHVARMGEGRGVYRVLFGETRGEETAGETKA